jgi:HlyD family secretion protein
MKEPNQLAITPKRKFEMKSFFRQKRAWLIGILIVLAGASVFTAYRVLSASDSQAVPSPQIQTAIARRGDLTVFASGVGEVIPASEINIGFDQSGTLSELLVAVGEKVQAGQVLARLDTGKSEQNIALALAQAQLNALENEQALDDLFDTAEMDAAQALKAVEDAQQALDDLQNSGLGQAQALQAVADAQEALIDAQRLYNNVRSTADQNYIDEANAELVLAEKNLKEAQSKYEEYANKPDNDLEKANRQLRLSAAQAAYDSILRNYNSLTSTGSEIDQQTTEANLAAANAALADAQRAYERVKDGPTQGEIALAEAELVLAQAQYETLKDGADPAAVELAQAKLADAQAQLALAQEDRPIIELVATMDGTILTIDANVGEAVGNAAIISMADLSLPVLKIYMDETDLNQVGIGYKVDVVFDALPDLKFIGHVTSIDPSLQSSGNIQTLVAEVQLDPESFSKPQSLPVGSNASVDVIGGETKNAVLIPVEALREIAPGEYAVFVMIEDQPKLRVVSVGLMDFTSVEITSGLEAGEIVTTGTIETNSSGS